MTDRIEIYRCVVGSTLHGLAIEGQDDRDEMGIYIEPPAQALGIDRSDHVSERSQPDGVRSQPGDLDYIAYSLRKFASLAAKGNPSIHLLFWIPEEFRLVDSELAEGIRQGLSQITRSMKVLRSYRGYLRNQLLRMKGEKGQKNVKRPELVEAYGYDTKYAMHAARLGLQGAEWGSEGVITLPMRDPHRTYLREMRTGKIPEEEALEFIEALDRELCRLIQENPLHLPEEPRRHVISGFVANAYLSTWGFEDV